MEFEYDVDWEVTKSFFCNAVDETGKSVAMGYYPGATWKQTLLLGGYGQNKANATVEPRYNFINLEPDHEYTLYIVAKNWEDTADFYYGDELYDGDKVVEIPFKTKPMVLDRPEDSKSVINVTCSNEQRQSFRIDYEWNDDTVCIYETVLWDKADPGTAGLIEDPYDYEAAKRNCSRWAGLMLLLRSILINTRLGPVMNPETLTTTTLLQRIRTVYSVK